MDSFQSRSNALEGMFFHGREQTAMETYVRRLVQEGKLPPSSLNVFEETKAEVRSRPASEYVYRHTKALGPGTPLHHHPSTQLLDTLWFSRCPAA